jgi:hypothetical protein
MKIKNTLVLNQDNIHLSQYKKNINIKYLRNTGRKERKNVKKILQNLFTDNYELIMNFIFSFLLGSVMWVQVPQWEADWSKCAVDIPDSSCHWYVAAPDNTFGEGFNWENAPWFDANGLQDISKIEKESVLEKLQNN